MKLGDKITKPVEWLDLDCTVRRQYKKRLKATGEVVYIDPKGMFYVLEFAFPNGKFKESFDMQDV